MPDAEAMVETLATVPLFAGLSRDALAGLARDLTTRRYRGGEVIFHVGDPADALFIVESGSVKIALPSETGHEAILAVARRGDHFGEVALIDGGSRPASAQAMEPTRALLLGRDRFRALLDEPAARDALLAGMATHLRRFLAQIEELHFLDVGGRLAARLDFLIRETGAPQGDGSLRMELPMSQGDLAAMVGCTRQTVNKLLGQLADDGIVRVDRERIVVTDPARLALLARR